LALAVLMTAACGQSQEPAATSASGSENAGAATTATTAAAPSEAPARTEAATSERIELAQADLSDVEAAGFVEGAHYFRLSPAQPTTGSTAPGQVEVAEFFMHSCIHCRNLEPFVEAWLEDKPAFVNFVRVPTTWNDVVRLHAQAFYAAESLGVIDEAQMPMFRQMHDQGDFLETPEKLASFFTQFGVNRDEFLTRMDSFAVRTKVNQAEELANRYRVDATPTIIINGKYKTGSEAGTPDQLFELIDLLAATETGQ
jgi:thiol:disulfide interchange protein DsbA